MNNKEFAEKTARILVELLKSYGVNAQVSGEYLPLSGYNYETAKAKQIGHTDCIRVSLTDYPPTDFIIFEDGTLATGATFMSVDAISEIIFHCTEYNADSNLFPDIYYEDGVKTYVDKDDEDNAVIFTTISKLRKWFAKWEWVEEEECEYSPF